MKRAALAVVLGVAFAACDPGPMPRVVEPRLFDSEDAFPTSSNEDPLPLDRAIMSGDLDQVRALLKQGANPNLRWSHRGDRLPIMEVLESPIYRYPVADRAEYLRLLLQHGADPNAKWCPFESRGSWDARIPRCISTKARTALHLAAFYGDRESVQLLLNAGADTSWRDWTGASALAYAYDEVVFELISGAQFPDLQTRDQKALAWVSDYDGSAYDRTPWRGTPIARALANDGGSIMVPPPPGEGGTMLQNRAVSRVRTLLTIGADPNERVSAAGFDWPPLMIALWSANTRAAAVLLRHDADVDARFCARSSARNFRLIGVKADPSCTAANGMTALMERARQNDANDVALLLEFKADRSLKDWAGRTALDYATAPAVRELLSAER
jgi:hypothetical protein